MSQPAHEEVSEICCVEDVKFYNNPNFPFAISVNNDGFVCLWDISKQVIFMRALHFFTLIIHMVRKERKWSKLVYLILWASVTMSDRKTYKLSEVLKGYNCTPCVGRSHQNLNCHSNTSPQFQVSATIRLR